MTSRLIPSIAVAATLLVLPLAGQDIAQTPTIVTTHHTSTIGGKVLGYTVRAGTIPIRDNETGEAHAHMFFVAYTLDRDPSAPVRPVTFLWNGGPGSNSGLVHLLGFGPRRLAKSERTSSTEQKAGTVIVENAETWLAVTDLVFVDPVGTGYSRPTKPEYADEFYQSQGDADSVAEFIRVCRLRLDASSAPIYLMGESYGVTRASLVAEVLSKRRTGVAGVILLSGGLPLDADVPEHFQDALNLPVWTAAAHFHKKLGSDLQQNSIQDAIRDSQEYAESDYADALARVDSLTQQEREAVLAQLQRFTSFPIAQIEAKSLQIKIDQVSTKLLGNDLMVGRYDSRMVGPNDKSGSSYNPTTDPSLKNIFDGAAVLRYIRGELGYKSDFLYQGPFGGGYPPPTTPHGDWMSVRWRSWKGLALASAKKDVSQAGDDKTPASEVADPPLEGLDAAMAADPDLRVFVASGYFDLVGDSFAVDHAARHLPQSIAARVTSRIYAGGHATYTDDEARRQLYADVVKFFLAGAQQ